MATIRDVAKRAGVSVSTVSLMINGKSNISNEKYKKVQEAMKELNFRPSFIAQNLKKRNLHLVGVVLPSMVGHYGKMFNGIADYLEQHKAYSMVCLSNYNALRENEVIDELCSLGVSSLIVCPCEPKNEKKYSLVVERNIPIVFLERGVNGREFSNVLYDNQHLIFSKTTELLQEYSPEELCLVIKDEDVNTEMECLNGFSDAYAALGKGPGTGTVLRVEMSAPTAMSQFADFFNETHTLPKCFIVSDYLVAENLYEIMRLWHQESEIYALADDTWRRAAKDESGIHRIARESYKLGETAAEIAWRMTGENMPTEHEDITVETNYITAKSNSGKQAVANTGKELNVLLFASNAMDSMVKLSANFEREYGIKLHFNLLPYNQLKDELTSEMDLGGTNYDVVMVDLPWIDSVVSTNYLQDMKVLAGDDKETMLSRFSDSVRPTFFSGRKIWPGLPVIATTTRMFYRRDLFEDKDLKWQFYNKYGFELMPPRNWTEYNYIAEFFCREYNPGSPLQYGTAVQGLKSTGIMEVFYVRQWAYNGSFVDKWGRIDINSSANMRALENLVQTFKYIDPNCREYFCDDVSELLLEGKIAFAECFTTHLTPYRYHEKKSKLDEFIDVVEIPGKKPMIGGWILGVTTKSPKKEEAFSFIQWATGEDLAVQNTLMGGAVPLKKVYKNTMLQQQYPWLKQFEQSFASRGMREIVRDKNGDPIDQYLLEYCMADEFYKAIDGKASVSETLVNAKEILEGLVQGRSAV